MHKIKITNCKNHIEDLTLATGSYTIGRSMDATLRLEGEEVSRLHARLLVEQSQCELIDEGSRNGTFVNGNRITSHLLNDGDIIKIGRFNLQFISDSAKPHFTPVRKKGVRSIFFLIAILLLTTGFYLYQKRIKLQLAERTAQYLAERNKEALYLGEYDSINILNLPPGVIKVAIWDRHGVLRAGEDFQSDSSVIELPIYYESVWVGTLRMKYKL